MSPEIVLSVIADLKRQRDALDDLIARLQDHYELASERPSNGRWTEAEDAALLRLIDVDGKTHQQAATRLGRTAGGLAAALPAAQGKRRSPMIWFVCGACGAEHANWRIRCRECGVFTDDRGRCGGVAMKRVPAVQVPESLKSDLKPGNTES